MSDKVRDGVSAALTADGGKQAAERSTEPLRTVVAFAPGRVNLIGDHTDYTGGLALPMAIDLGTEVIFSPDRSAAMVELSSSIDPETARIPLEMAADPWEVGMLLPEWARHVGAVVAVTHPLYGGKGTITTTLPVGAGLSSSASLEVALALALGFAGGPTALARACQRAEQVAAGVRTGIMDQLTITLAQRGHAMLLDCSTLAARPVPVPDQAELLVVHSGVTRSVAGSAYAERRAECEAAERQIGPLRSASPWEVDRISDPILRKRARHVVSENARVRGMVGALEHGDLKAAGSLMNESHASLSMDFEVSLPELDALCDWLQGMKGVHGVRLTGAGMGGCVVALAERGAIRLPLRGHDAWIVRPTGPASRQLH